mgnify:CR=1 FL=1
MRPSSPQLGVCYYPEHWPEAQWEADARHMYEMGLSWVRIGEFAWSRMEATPGVLTWEWLDRAIDVLGRAGLKVVLCTPTATPPRWMVDKYPNMLAKGADEAIRKFGSRRHYCFSHLGYRDECARIADLMGQRFGQNPYIKAWQIDNEYGCHDTILSYGIAAQTAFQDWLKIKYQDVRTLNSAWGNVFWSMEYDSLDQVELPNQTVTEANPAHVMDYRRFASDEVVSFNSVQVNALRKHTDVPLIHNYMGRITEFDHFKVGKDLDIASWDSYPLGFLEDRSDQGDDFKHRYMRQGDPDFQAFHHDLYRAVGRGNWWVMEQQPGPVNWAPYNPKPLAGMVRLWTWEAIAHGADVVSYFRWRQAPFAQEQMHSGLQRPDGEPSECHEDILKVAEEIKSLGTVDTKQADVALVFDYASAWAWDTQPQCQDFDYFRLVYEAYSGLRKLGLSIDILPADTDQFGDRKLVVIPGLFAWTDALTTAIKSFKGQVVLGPRTGSKTQDFQIPQNLPPNLKGFEAKVTSVETLRPSAPIELEGGGHFYIWREHIQTSLNIVEKGRDGSPAHISKDNLHYLAGWPDREAMTRILRGIAKRAGIDTTEMHAGHRCRDIGSYTLHMNYGVEPLELDGFTLGSASIALIDKRTQKRVF